MDRDDLRERVAALKHDLAKYVAWRSVNLADDAWRLPLGASAIESLQHDILETRTRRDGGVEAAWEVWDRLLAGVALPELPEVRRAAAAVELLRSAEGLLRSGDAAALSARVTELRGAQTEIRAALRDLARRLAGGEA
jgi:hypothetical protein